MTFSLPVKLPDNLPECHALICRQAEVIAELTARIEQLSQELATLKRQVYGSRRERFVASTEEDAAGKETMPDGGVLDGEPTDGSPGATPEPAPPRTSKGRQKRVIDPSIPREKVLHPLDEQKVFSELLNDPRARRFYRFVREEVELQEARIRVLEHYGWRSASKRDPGRHRIGTHLGSFS